MNTRAEDLLLSLSFVGEDLIREADTTVKRYHFLPVAGSLIAAVLLLVFLTIPKQNAPLPPVEPIVPDEPNELHVNWAAGEQNDLQGALRMDMDVEILTHLIPDEEMRQQWIRPVPGNEELDPELAEQLRAEHDAWYALMQEFSAAIGTDGDALLTALGGEFEITTFYTRLVRAEKDGPYELLHDYCLELRSAGGGSAVVSLSGVAAPLRCYLILDEDGAQVSRIGETELVINGCEVNGNTLYLTRFTRNAEQSDGETAAGGCVWYDVETENFSLGELETLLTLLLAENAA